MKLAFIGSLFYITLTYISLANANTELSTKRGDYCKNSGGEIVQLTPTYYTKSHKYVKGQPKDFCQFYMTGHNSGYSEIMDLDSFETTVPNFAATIAQILHINPYRKLPSYPSNDPGIEVCRRLGGSQMAFTNEGSNEDNKSGDELEMCVFGDGSTISGWTLIYLSLYPYDTKLRTSIHSEALDIEIPSLYHNND